MSLYGNGDSCSILGGNHRVSVYHYRGAGGTGAWVTKSRAGNNAGCSGEYEPR